MVHIGFWYADDVDILGGSVHTIRKNTETLLVGSKEMGLEVNADKTRGTWSCLEISMQDAVTIQRLIIVSLKGWNVSNTWNKLNESKFYSGRK